MMDLISRSRGCCNLPAGASTGAELATLDGLIAAASRAIENYCGRRFHLETRDELHDGVADRRLLLEHHPLVRIDRVACRPTAVLTTASATGSRASVHVSDTGLSLTRLEAGSASVETVDFADAPTVAELAGAVNDLGDWSALVTHASYADYASADLARFPGAQPALDSPAQLRMHVEEVGDFLVDESHGYLLRDALWTGGTRFWRIQSDQARSRRLAALRNPRLVPTAPEPLPQLSGVTMLTALNVTCSIFRAGNAPPDPPDVANVAGFLQAAGWPNAAPSRPYSHTLLVETGVDLRDDYDAGVVGTNADTVYVADTPFAVIFVERLQRGAPGDHLRAYLDRQVPTWPTTDL